MSFIYLKHTIPAEIISDFSAIEPDSLMFHRDRYESGRYLRDAISYFQCGERGAGMFYLRKALKATRTDGGDEGTIPCLGGEPERVWRKWLPLIRKLG